MKHNVYILSLVIASFLASSLCMGESAGEKSVGGKASGKKTDGQEAKNAKPIAPKLVPVRFGTAGKRVSIMLPPGEKLVLRAFGRVIAEPSSAKTDEDNTQTATTFTLPAVRVPVTFDITRNNSTTPLAKLVVYPKGFVRFDAERVVLVGAMPLAGNIQEWTQAVGIEISTESGYSLDVGKGHKVKLKILLKEKQNNLILIEPPLTIHMIPHLRAFMPTLLSNKWGLLCFEDVLPPLLPAAKAKGIEVYPRQFRLGLAKVATQKWARPLVFPYRKPPVKIIANRHAWVVDKNGLPLVEQIATGEQRGQSVFVSYLPWQFVLGQQEVADATFVAMLEAMGKSKYTLPDRTRYVVWIHKPDGRGPEKRTRPVLSAVELGLLRGEDVAYQPNVVHVIDLRGKNEAKQVKTLLEAIDKESKRDEKVRREHPSKATTSWIILGDDPALKQWEWLTSKEKAIDSFRGVAKKKRNDEVLQKGLRGFGVYWLDDDTLPSKWETQVRLMQILTELGVPIKTTLLTEGKK